MIEVVRLPPGVSGEALQSVEVLVARSKKALSPEELKAKKAEYNRAYAARQKGGRAAVPESGKAQSIAFTLGGLRLTASSTGKGVSIEIAEAE